MSYLTNTLLINHGFTTDMYLHSSSTIYFISFEAESASMCTVRAFGALNGCRSVTCGGVCCDALYTYGSAMNTNQPCTQPLPTCSASGQCQSQPRLATDVCVGLQFGFQSYPGNSLAISKLSCPKFSLPLQKRKPWTHASAIQAPSKCSICKLDSAILTTTVDG